MMMTRTRTQLRSASGVRSAAVPRPTTLRVRAQGERQTKTTEKPAPVTRPSRVPENPLTKAAGTDGKPLDQFTVFNPTNEAINGRAAMIGIFAAFISELITSKPVYQQLAGVFYGSEPVERPIGLAFLGFGFVVAILTLATVIPKQVSNENPENDEVGPFTAKAELWNGRAAQIGFLSLVIIEVIKGSAIF